MVRADDGRLVKFIGDEVMWVSSTAGASGANSRRPRRGPSERKQAGLQVRAGLGYGEVLAIGGDYFGNAVNLAARLVAAAAPGQILAPPDVRDELRELAG